MICRICVNDTTAEDCAALDATEEDDTSEDSTVELSKKGRQCGGSHDSHFTMDAIAEPNSVPNNKLVGLGTTTKEHKECRGDHGTSSDTSRLGDH